MVKNPKYGYGKNMNPCIDCHALMLKQAKKIMEDENYDFIATGEILGQRPMSQNKRALKTVAEFSGVGEKLVRPMSAKLLDETEPERNNKITRGKLLDISGRTRDRQIELVKKYGLREYASPGGGCLLTDPGFSEKLIKILDYWPECSGKDIELLKYGRVFWMNMKEGKVLVIIARNKEECEKLEKLAKKGDAVMELEDMVGPTALVRNCKLQITNGKHLSADKAGIPNIKLQIPKILKKSELGMDKEKSGEEILELAGLLTGWYATKARGQQANIHLRIYN